MIRWNIQNLSRQIFTDLYDLQRSHTRKPQFFISSSSFDHYATLLYHPSCPFCFTLHVDVDFKLSKLLVTDKGSKIQQMTDIQDSGNLFCTSWPLASTRWILLTFSSLCLLFYAVTSIDISNIKRKILGWTLYLESAYSSFTPLRALWIKKFS